MNGFGKLHWNRRVSSREPIVLEGVLSTLAASRTAILEDVSCTGARFRSATPPETGKDVLVRIGRVAVLAKVVWRDGNGCGVRFEQRLAEGELRELRVEDISSSIADLSEEERLAAQEWISGFAR